MVRNFYFKDRDGQTPLPEDLQNGLIPQHIQTIGELDEYEEANIAEGLIWLDGHNHSEFLKYGFWPTAGMANSHLGSPIAGLKGWRTAS